MTREELLEQRSYWIAKASNEYWQKYKDNEDVGIMTAFEEGMEYADEHPDWRTILKAFWMFEQRGLIKEDLCFDPEHFIKTIIMEHWNDKPKAE